MTIPEIIEQKIGNMFIEVNQAMIFTLLKKMKETGMLVDIILLDHLIISSGERDYYKTVSETKETKSEI